MNQTKARKQAAQRLKKARNDKRQTVGRISKQLKVPESTIKALENHESTDIPDAQRQGLTRLYMKELGILNAEMKLLLRHMAANEVDSLKPISKLASKRSFVLSRASVVIFLAVVLSAILAYTLFQARNLTAAPRLNLTSPSKTYSIVNSNSLKLSGSSTVEATVLVNGDPVQLDNEGNFETVIYLQPGHNSLDVRALNSFSREAIISRTVFLEEIEL